MTAEKKSTPRREQILQSLAHMLETHPGQRITTAALAAEVGVSEAALYRHFPSKFKMFEGLIEFVEEAVFSRVNQISTENLPVLDRLQRILSLVLGFAERNPGLSRLLTGEALTGEDPRLRQRVSQIFERLETQCKQLLRQAEIDEGVRTSATVSAVANLLTAFAEGRISQYVRSGFRRKPTDLWQEQWQALGASILR